MCNRLTPLTAPPPVLLVDFSLEVQRLRARSDPRRSSPHQRTRDRIPPAIDEAVYGRSEEHGFVGAVFVLLLYFLILMRLIQNAQTAADLPGSLIIMGIVAVLTFQIAVNVGMVIGFMPVTGIPLPLMSYGGSSVLFTFLALGVVMNIRMRRFVN